MNTTGRRSRERFRPGLTLIELLGAILFFGLMGALLLPRLAPVRSPALAGDPARADDSVDGACLPTDNSPVFDGLWAGRHQTAYVGIGAALDLESSRDGYPRIYQPFSGSPAESAGIEPGDLIQQVDGISVQYDSVERVAVLIRSGSIGTPVQLTVSRADDSQPMDVTITRACIHPPAPFARAAD